MRWTLLFSALFLSFSVFGQGDFKVDYHEYDLDNGLHVILHQDSSAPVVATTIMYHVGSKNEDPNATGTAHFLEHLMFEGSENIGRGEFANYAEAAGGRLNANTSWDRTYYYEKLPSNQLELGLWLESERLMHAVAADRQEGVETQRDVVIEERKQRMDNQPYGGFHVELKKRIFQDHPYQHPLIGYMDHLEDVSAEELNAIYDKYYVPNNAVLVVAGDIDIDSTKKLIEGYFGPIPQGEEVEQPDVDEPRKLSGEIRDTVYDQVQLPGVVHGFKTPGIGAEDYYATDMLMRVLARGESSRLTKRIKEEQELAMQIYASPFPMYDDPGMSLTFAIANSGVEPEELHASIGEEYKRVIEEGITETEYEKIRNQIRSELIQQNDDIAQKAENLATYYLLRGNTSLINQEVERYMSVTREDIQKAAEEYLDPSNRVVLFYLPESEK